MTTAKNLAIWMDHSNAHLTEFAGVPITTNILHNRERHQPLEFYKKIGDVIKNYEEVLIFGPATAKTELLTILRADRHFEKIKLETKECDKMTQNEQHLFVKNHFLHNL